MKRLYFMLLLVLASMQLSAENEQTVTVNGITIDKVVKSISFDGDFIVLAYTDDTSDREDMEQVSLAFTYDEYFTGVEQIKADQDNKFQQVFNLNGMAVGKSFKGLHRGVYIVNGKKVLVK